MLGAIEVMYYADKKAQDTPFNKGIFVNNNTVTDTQRTGIWFGNVVGGAVKDNNLSGWGQSGGSLGTNTHLPDETQACASDLFKQGIVGWFNQGITGGILSVPQDCYGTGN